LRKLILLFILSVPTLTLKAQDSYNFTKYGVGFNASYAHPYADLEAAKQSYTFSVAGYYNLTPYIPIGLEIQFGQLAGGSVLTDPAKREYNNHFKALIAHGDVQLGQLIDYSGSFLMRLAKDLYMGTGVGVISNNMAFIQRTNLVPSTGYPVGTYTFPGKNTSLNLLVPIRFGYEYKIYDSFDEPFLGISIGYTHNLTWGEGLDGYTDPSSGFKNNAQDQYSQIVVGVRFNFGSSIPFTKQIN
jgi:hypothetical protein